MPSPHLPSPAHPLRAVVLSCDRWHVDFLGCYGNDWIETPNLQRLAAQGVTFDRHFAACVDPELSVRAWWTGKTQLPVPALEAPHDWPVGSLPRNGVRTVLFLESSAESASHTAPPFDEVIVASGRDDLEARESDTPFARLVVQVEQWLAQNHADDRPTLLWLKCRGIPVPWLPPQGFADLYLDDFGLVSEPESASDLTGGSGVPPDFPEDEMVEFAEEQDLSSEQERMPVDARYAHALYASYVTLLDRWIGRLLTKLEKQAGWAESLVVFTAATGQVLENVSLEEDVDAPADAPELPLRGELIQSPLIVRLPSRDTDDGAHAGTRRPALVQTIDLLPTLADWFGIPIFHEVEGKSLLPIIRQQAESHHEALMMGDGTGALALRTNDFLYIEEPSATSKTQPRELLFEKPFDRWDHSNIAAQSPALVDDLRSQLQDRLKSLEPGGS